MCESMADIQSATAEIRRGKEEERRKKEERKKKERRKKEERRRKKPQGKNTTVCPIP